MKSNLRLTITLILLIFNLSELICRGNTTNSNTITISGKIFNTNLKIKKVRIIAYRVGVDNDNYYIELSDTGSFSIKFNNYYPSDVRVIYDKSNFLFLAHPGDRIQLEFDNKNKKDVKKSVRFKGDGWNENLKVIKFQMLADSLWSIYDNAPNMASKSDQITYKNYLDSLNKISLTCYNEFVKREKPGNEVKIWSYYFSQENYLNCLYSFPEWHSKSENYKDWKIPLSYYDYQKEFLPINREHLVSTYFYGQLVNKFWGEILYHIYLSNKDKIESNSVINSDSLKFYGIINSSHDPLTKQLILAELLKQRIRGNDFSIYEKYRALINNILTEPFLKIPLQEKYELAKQRIAKPQFVSDAIFHDFKSTSVKSIIDSIVNSNKAKVIYVDCWGPWCAPCLKELPYSIEMMDNLGGKDVSFVFLCIDSEIDRWKAKISELKLNGHHYFLNKEQSTELREVLKIDGVPFYILLNKRGLIVEKGTHLRASDPNTLKKISDLLNEQ